MKRIKFNLELLPYDYEFRFSWDSTTNDLTTSVVNMRNGKKAQARVPFFIVDQAKFEVVDDLLERMTEEAKG